MVRLTMDDGHVLEMDEEVTSLFAETQNDTAPYRPRPRIVVAKSAPPYRQAWCWAMVSLMVVLVVLLLSTDSFEVNITLRGIESSRNKQAPTTTTTTTEQQQHTGVQNPVASNPSSEESKQTTEESRKTPISPAETKPAEVPAPASEPDKPKATTAEAATTQTTARTESLTTTTTGSGAGVSPANFPFRYRGPQLDQGKKGELATKWGKWSLTDSKPRPSVAEVCGSFSHCDVPRDKFPANAWQTDAEFLNRFLTQAQDLVSRAQETILAEYGESKFDQPGKSIEERSANFQLTIRRLGEGKDHAPGKREVIDNGGWISPRSYQGLVRRLLHAIVTQDTFTFVMGGHSAAAAHGNYFKQSYTMQFHKVMEPVFARLGVKLESYNMAQGGLGTIQNAMAMGSLYGNEIDVCMWDSGMTESSSAHYDLYARQALIGGNRVPMLWGGISDALETLHDLADADVGGPGTGMKGLPETQSEEDAAKLPYAVRYLTCNNEIKNVCNANKYNAICWIPRPDFNATNQIPQTKGRASWHPGFRSHQLAGRLLAYMMLLGLQDAIKKWKDADKFALPDSEWHVAEYYKNIRNKLALANNTACFGDTGLPSTRLCSTPMKGVSEFTPRFRPDETSIRSIMKDRSYLPPVPRNLYDGPDVYNPALEPPEGEINYLAIVENDDKQITGRRHLRSLDATQNSERDNSYTFDHRKLKEFDQTAYAHRALGAALPIGRGWTFDLKAGDSHCNGTWDSECGRGAGDNCLLYGHNDGRGGFMFDSFSGWLVLQFTIKEGLIIIKFDTWYPAEAVSLTKGWTVENNGASRRELFDMDGERELKGTPPVICPEFSLEYSINGKITKLSLEQFNEKKKHVQRVVETLTLLDDPSYTSGKDVEVELGLRMQGCQRLTTFHLTHVYWA